MLTTQELEVLKQHLLKRVVVIPRECMILRFKDVLDLLEAFTVQQENNNGKEETKANNDRKEEEEATMEADKRDEQMEEEVKSESSAESNGIEPKEG